MKTLRNFLVAMTVILLATPTVMAQTDTAVEDTTQVVTLTAENGEAVGSALSSLYSQFKQAGQLDMKNPVNIANVVTIANNTKGISKTKDVADFVSGLVSSSKGLITDENVSAVLSTLGSLSSLDLGALGGGTAKVAVSGLLSKVGVKSGKGNDGESSKASSILTGLFNGLK